ncbi:MAG: carboxypeptidase-like regulatory domain-containing protein [Kofleriaceae bacterium]
MSTRKPTETTIDMSALVRAVLAPFDKADDERAANLANLANSRIARGYMMQRVRDKRAAKLGPAAPEVLALDNLIVANTELATALAMESTVATKTSPVAGAGETVVHGFVRDAANKPVEGIKLTLVPPNGEVLDRTASAKDGYFVLRTKVPREQPQQLELRVHDKRHRDSIRLDREESPMFVTVRLED